MITTSKSPGIQIALLHTRSDELAHSLLLETVRNYTECMIGFVKRRAVRIFIMVLGGERRVSCGILFFLVGAFRRLLDCFLPELPELSLSLSFC